jgi:ADP-ribose pyrophosphatase YjhB (NUDIX family)
MILEFSCDSKCCQFLEEPYEQDNDIFEEVFSKRKRDKAGIFIYDPKTTKVLLVKSRGFKWGLPKGTREFGDKSLQECAIREVKEETGISVPMNVVNKSRYYKCDRATYYYLEMDEVKVTIQNQIAENDAMGIGWIKMKCLKELVKTKKIYLNSHTKTCMWIFLRQEMRF